MLGTTEESCATYTQMTKAEAKIRISKLREQIDYYRFQYHVLDHSEISDAAQDSLKHELQQLEEQYPGFISPDSPTQRVGGKPLPEFSKVKHRSRMISLNDVFAFEEVQAWENRIKKILPPKTSLAYFAEVKIDGLALSLIYRDGLLVRAATRGDGSTGEDVTQNAKTIEAIPLRLQMSDFQNAPREIEIRGEAYMSRKVFEQLNARQNKNGGAQFANPRNAAAGAIRQLDPKITASRKLSFLAYDIATDLGLETHAEVHRALTRFGFQSGTINRVCHTIEEIEKYHKDLDTDRNKLPYWTDGNVVSVNDLELYKKLGVVGKAPRGAIAYKYPAEQATTIVEAIAVQVGRTGALTPVAHLRPVNLAGSTVSRATLHNLDEIRRLDVRVGDTVIIQKAGEIIPDIIQVLPKFRTGKERLFHMPARCPICGSKVSKPEGAVAHYCTNKNCFAQRMESLQHFVSKGALDIDGLGPKILESLWNADLIRNAGDLFELQESDLQPLERFAEKSAANLVSSLQAKRQGVELWRFIYALGIRHVGEQTSRDLAQNFGSFEKFQSASVNALQNIPDIGGVVAESIIDFFKDLENCKLVDRLQHLLKVQTEQRKKSVGPLNGKTVVVTGTLERFSREEAKEVIRAAGGRWTSSVSEKTGFVVVGSDPGSKAGKAKKFGVTVLSEEQFASLLKKGF